MKHFQNVCSKISRSNYIINKVKNILPKSSLRTLYSSLIQSYINYGIIIWGCSYHTEKVNKKQKKAMRIINNKGYTYHTEPLYRTCEILNVHANYKYYVLTFMYQLKNNLLPNSFNTLYYFTEPGRSCTRQSKLANCGRFRTTYTSRLPLHRLPRIWNELDTKFHDIESLKSFKKNVRNNFLNKYSANIRCTNTRCKQCFHTLWQYGVCYTLWCGTW